jgi:hypothetical protein
LRDLEEADIEAVVGYWFGTADLEFLGIDTMLMGTPDTMRAHYRSRLRNGDKNQKSISYVITLDGAMIGYTILNQYAPDTNYSHWHIITPNVRAGGISSALYPFRIKMYFDTTNLQRLIHQTRTRNIGVNRMLDKFVPIAETGYVEKPDGIAGPGEFHTRYVTRADLPRLMALASR